MTKSANETFELFRSIDWKENPTLSEAVESVGVLRPFTDPHIELASRRNVKHYRRKFNEVRGMQTPAVITRLLGSLPLDSFQEADDVVRGHIGHFQTAAGHTLYLAFYNHVGADEEGKDIGDGFTDERIAGDIDGIRAGFAGRPYGNIRWYDDSVKAKFAQAGPEVDLDVLEKTTAMLNDAIAPTVSVQAMNVGALQLNEAIRDQVLAARAA